jgi:phosphopantetheine adenylyltransferase
MTDFGPTRSDPSFEAIVCSAETQKGCENGIYIFINSQYYSQGIWAINSRYL